MTAAVASTSLSGSPAPTSASSSGVVDVGPSGSLVDGIESGVESGVVGSGVVGSGVVAGGMSIVESGALDQTS
jgi:hypothetical protein